MKTTLKIVLCLVLPLLCACAQSGTESDKTVKRVNYGKVQGTVTDPSGLPLSGVTVRAEDGAVLTDLEGKYSIQQIPEGPSSIVFSKPGYKVATQTINVVKNESLDCSSALPINSETAEYDIIVAGAGTGGISAAIQAARMGMKVAVIEETDWIGGQMTAASVTSLDEDKFFMSNRSGIYNEFHTAIVKHYAELGKSTGTAYFLPNTTAFEPSVGQKILYRILNRSGFDNAPDIFLSQRVVGVSKTGNEVTGITLAEGAKLNCKILIDATEHGDIIPLTGARYRSGNRTSDHLNLDANLNPLTFCAVIKKYQSDTQNPFLFTGPPSGYPGGGYYNGWLTLEGAADASSWFREGKIIYPLSFAFVNSWRGMPDSSNPLNYDASYDKHAQITKTAINHFHNDYPVTVRYLEDLQYRKQVHKAAKMKTLWLLYYMQRDLGQTQWSVATDEGYDTRTNRLLNFDDSFSPDLQPMLQHFPVIPYVRESRRVIGMYTMNASDIKRDGIRAYRNFPSSLAVGDYPIDLHGGDRPGDLDCGDTSADIPTVWDLAGGAFQVPFETFIPEVIDGFIVAEKNLSVSRLVGGAIRLQPITMMTGQAAGAIAAVAVKQGIQPRQVRPMDVQKVLLDAGCIISKDNYGDVPNSHPFWWQIQLASSYGIISGINGDSFGVYNTIASDEVLAAFQKAFGEPSKIELTEGAVTRGKLAEALGPLSNSVGTGTSSSPLFDDISSTHPAYAAIQALASKGIINECSPRNFCAEKPLSRGEATAWIINAVTVGGITPATYVPLYTDSQLPTGSITINDGAETTTKSNVTLTISAIDFKGTVQDMQLSKDNKHWYNWEPYVTKRTSVLINGPGKNTIYIRFRDGSGNVSTVYEDSILLTIN